MKFRNLAVASVAAVAFLGVSAARASADPAMQCEVHQRQLLRVALSVAIGPSTVDASAITRVVEQLWAPEGVDIEWIDETQAAAEDRLDAWVVIGRKASESSKVPAREINVSRRVVGISIDEVMSRFEQTLSLQMQVSRESARHLMLGNAHLIERSLGYAVAHKLGHSLMGLSHAATGLMSDAYDTVPGLTGVPASNLDAESRQLLQKRFGVGCVAAR
jgi:hypothetical protein